MTQLSGTAIRICNENYPKNCSGCPIRKACVTTIPYGQEALDKWIDSVNDMAEKVSA